MKFSFQKFFLDTQKNPPLQRPSRSAGAHDSLVTSIIHMYIIKKSWCIGIVFQANGGQSENTKEVLGIRVEHPENV